MLYSYYINKVINNATLVHYNYLYTVKEPYIYDVHTEGEWVRP